MLLRFTISLRAYPFRCVPVAENNSYGTHCNLFIPKYQSISQSVNHARQIYITLVEAHWAQNKKTPHYILSLCTLVHARKHINNHLSVCQTLRNIALATEASRRVTGRLSREFQSYDCTEDFCETLVP